jgi:hypothetical protein
MTEIKPSSSNSSDKVAESSSVQAIENLAALTKLYNPHVDISGVDEQKLLRKLDWRLVPWLSFLYLLSFLDRASIGNARVRSSFASGFLSNKSISTSYMAWRKTSI